MSSNLLRASADTGETPGAPLITITAIFLFSTLAGLVLPRLLFDARATVNATTAEWTAVDDALREMVGSGSSH